MVESELDINILLQRKSQTTPRFLHFMKRIYDYDKSFNFTSCCSSGLRELQFLNEDLKQDTYLKMHVGNVNRFASLREKSIRLLLTLDKR